MPWPTFYLQVIISYCSDFIPLMAPWLPFGSIKITMSSQIARFVGPTWGPPGSWRPQVGPTLSPWMLLSGIPMKTNDSKCKYISIFFKTHIVHVKGWSTAGPVILNSDRCEPSHAPGKSIGNWHGLSKITATQRASMSVGYGTECCVCSNNTVKCLPRNNTRHNVVWVRALNIYKACKIWYMNITIFVRVWARIELKSLERDSHTPCRVNSDK